MTPEPEDRDRSAPAVAVRGLRVIVSGSSDDIIDQIDLELVAGQVLGLVGESGSGKTTLAMALLGYCRPGSEVNAGTVLIGDRDLASLSEAALRSMRGGEVAYIPQDPAAALNPALRIGGQLEETLRAHLPSLGPAEIEQRLQSALSDVALPADPGFLRRYPHQLSGGQQQRLVIAMAFICRAPVIVCDEPTTGLDVTTQSKVLATVRELCRKYGIASVYVSHDLAVVAGLADRVAVMYAGRIVETGPTNELFARPRHPYTRRLMRAVPDVGADKELAGIPGRAPLPGSRPPGCAFQPRCEFATQQCLDRFPPVTLLGPQQSVRCHRLAEVAAANDTAPILSRRDPTHEGTELLAVRGLSAHHGQHQVLFDVDLSLRPAECLAVVGESGSGKTTLARCIAGLHDRYSGAVQCSGETLPGAVRKRSASQRREIQYIFQSPYASLNPRRTVGQTIARQVQLLTDAERPARTSRVAAALRSVALDPSTARRFPEQLSGGERQRVAIARALVGDPSVVICDEVTSALDVSVQAAIIDLLNGLRRESDLSLLFITHNLALIRSIADRVIVLKEGRIVEQGLVDDVFARPAHPYTQLLLQNIPRLDQDAVPAAV